MLKTQLRQVEYYTLPNFEVLLLPSLQMFVEFYKTAQLMLTLTIAAGFLRSLMWLVVLNANVSAKTVLLLALISVQLVRQLLLVGLCDPTIRSVKLLDYN